MWKSSSAAGSPLGPAAGFCAGAAPARGVVGLMRPSVVPGPAFAGRGAAAGAGAEGGPADGEPRWAKATLPGAEFPSWAPSKSSHFASEVALMPWKRSAKSSGFVACR